MRKLTIIIFYLIYILKACNVIAPRFRVNDLRMLWGEHRTTRLQLAFQYVVISWLGRRPMFDSAEFKSIKTPGIHLWFHPSILHHWGAINGPNFNWRVTAGHSVLFYSIPAHQFALPLCASMHHDYAQSLIFYS